MDFTIISNLDQRKESDLLVLPFWKEKKGAHAAAEIGSFAKSAALPIKAQDFTGKEGEVLILYNDGKHESRVALIGLGEKEKCDVEKLRRAYGNLAKAARKCKAQTISLILPSGNETDVVRGVSEGILLSNYSYDKLKHDSIKEDPTVLIKKVQLIGATKKGLEVAKKYGTIADSVYFVRDLVNGNADEITPQFLVETARGLTKKFPKIKTTIFDKKRIVKEKMGLLLAVNQGSSRDPAVIILEYQGNPKSKEVTAVVGKGITYDTGGLNIKTSGMETMKTDMSGAAIALGTIRTAAMLGLKVNLVAVIPTTENSVSAHSYKPGDVFQSYSGKTVEIGNTDAEGRLILADALAYTAKNLKPTRIIDFATLTGSIVIALGDEAIGLFSNDDVLAEKISAAGKSTFERVWRMPLFEEYKAQLKSDVADINNIGGRPAGSITAATFLKEFVGDIPWAHLDIAGVAYQTKEKRYNPKLASGVGVRLMIDLLE